MYIYIYTIYIYIYIYVNKKTDRPTLFLNGYVIGNIIFFGLNIRVMYASASFALTLCVYLCSHAAPWIVRCY